MDFPKRVSDHWVIARLNDIPIGRKLVGLFLFCVLIPISKGFRPPRCVKRGCVLSDQHH